MEIFKHHNDQMESLVGKEYAAGARHTRMSKN
jgi:hypothetical protein